MDGFLKCARVAPRWAVSSIFDVSRGNVVVIHNRLEFKRAAAKREVAKVTRSGGTLKMRIVLLRPRHSNQN